jgi:uncharacterized protein (UPF0276 family)
MHLAGHTDCGTHLIDTHDGHVVDPVWELYRMAHQRSGGMSTLLEWDARIPAFQVVHAEVLKAKQMLSNERIERDESTQFEEAPSLRSTSAEYHSIPHPATITTAEVE